MRRWGTFDEVDAMTVPEVFGLIRDTAASDEEYEAGSAQYLIRNVYDQAMEFDGNAQVFSEILARCGDIDRAENIRELMALWKELYRSYGAEMPFVPLVRQDYFKAGKYALMIEQSRGMCGSAYEDIADSDDACISMKNYIRDMLMAMGDGKDIADSRASDAVRLALETAHATDFSAGKAANPLRGLRLRQRG